MMAIIVVPSPTPRLSLRFQEHRNLKTGSVLRDFSDRAPPEALPAGQDTRTGILPFRVRPAGHADRR